jgi:hypothetical protein
VQAKQLSIHNVSAGSSGTEVTVQSKFRLIVTVLALVVALTLAAASASAETKLVVKVPFQFQVERTLMPAGTYTIERTSSNSADAYLIRAQEGVASAAFTTHPADGIQPGTGGRIDFDKRGDTYYLVRFWMDGSDTAREIGQLYVELKIADEESETLLVNVGASGR